MARPSKGERATVSLRIGRDDLAAIDVYASARGLDRNAAMIELIRRGLDGGHAAVEPPPLAPPAPAALARQSVRSETVVLEPIYRLGARPVKRLRGYDPVTREPIYD